MQLQPVSFLVAVTVIKAEIASVLMYMEPGLEQQAHHFRKRSEQHSMNNAAGNENGNMMTARIANSTWRVRGT